MTHDKDNYVVGDFNQSGVGVEDIVRYTIKGKNPCRQVQQL